MAIVLDASVALVWCFDDEEDALADHVLMLIDREQMIAPPIWPLEVANTIARSLIHERVDDASAATAIGLMRRVGVVVSPIATDEMFGAVLALARTHKLTAYDASYLFLAQREGLPLATLDKRLREAARTVGVRLIE